jgi:hypothetical protein
LRVSQRAKVVLFKLRKSLYKGLYGRREDTLKLIAIDPGQTSGVCFYDGTSGGTGWEFVQMGPKPHHNKLYQLLEDKRPYVIVCEDFVYMHREHVVLTPVEYIGIAHLYAVQQDIPFVKQPPGAPKKFWTGEKLKRVGLYKPSQGHAMDALRHALYYLTFTAKDTQWIEALR